MGYASPAVGYVGYAASDDVLMTDTTEYSTTETDYTTVAKLTKLSDVRPNSTFRIKVDIKGSSGAPDTQYFKMVDTNGNELLSFSDQGFAYETKTNDITYLGGEVYVQIKATAGETCFITNLQLLGKETPMIFRGA